MAGHLLVLKRLARILPPTGRTMRAVRNRNAVACTQAGEIPPLHRASPAFARRRTRDVDKLADDEMISGDFGPDRNQCVFIHSEFGKLAFGLDLGDRKMTASGPRSALH